MIEKGFIRVKIVKGNRYAYYVVNKWKKGKGSRQKVKGYLGKVLKLEKKDLRDFLTKYKIIDVEAYVKNESTDSIILELIKHELIAIGFQQNHNIFVFNNIEFDSNEKKLYIIEKNKKKNIVLELNEGFMCNRTLDNLFHFKAAHTNNPYLLAKAFLEAGLNVPKELFVALYEKFF